MQQACDLDCATQFFFQPSLLSELQCWRVGLVQWYWFLEGVEVVYLFLDLDVCMWPGSVGDPLKRCWFMALHRSWQSARYAFFIYIDHPSQVIYISIYIIQKQPTQKHLLLFLSSLNQPRHLDYPNCLINFVHIFYPLDRCLQFIQSIN